MNYYNIFNQYINCQVPLSQIPIIESIDPATRENSQKNNQRAIVIGASFAGLTTAALLSRHYGEVIIVERSEYIEGESIVRSRQGRQSHVICHRSLLVWERLFPGFMGELDKVVQDGVSQGHLRQKGIPGKHIKYSYFGKNVSDTSEIDDRTMYVLTRAQVESVLKKRIDMIGNVHFMYNCQVDKRSILTEVNQSDQHLTVKQVTISNKGGQTFGFLSRSDANLTLSCDLFVNCGGYGGHNLMRAVDKKVLELRNENIRKKNPNKNENEMLKQSSVMEISKIDCKIRYKTILFDPKPEFIDEEGNFIMATHENENDGQRRQISSPYYMVYHVLTHPKRKGFLAMPFSHGKILFMLHTYDTKIDNFSTQDAKKAILDYCQDEPEMFKDAQSIFSRLEDKAHEVLNVWEKDGSHFVNYEHLECGSLLNLGDCVGSLNPIYGQGITMSVDSALLLNQFIERHGTQSMRRANVCTEFQSELNRAYFVPWMLCSTVDLCHDFTEYSSRLAWQKKISGPLSYVTSRLFSAANESEQAADYLFKVLFMEQGYRRQLMNPWWILGRVFRKESLCLIGGFSIALLSWLTCR